MSLDRSAHPLQLMRLTLSGRNSYRVHMPPGVKRVAGPAARAAMEQAGLLVNPHPKRKLSPSSLPDEEKKLP